MDRERLTELPVCGQLLSDGAKSREILSSLESTLGTITSLAPLRHFVSEGQPWVYFLGRMRSRGLLTKTLGVTLGGSSFPFMQKTASCPDKSSISYLNFP